MTKGDGRSYPPAGLALAGKRVWRKVAQRYELRPDELILLENAARTADYVASLDAALVGEPLTVLGSQGQVREHPLLSEARQQRALLARLLAQLKLPDEDSGQSSTMNRSVQARDAAHARWHMPAAVKGGR